MSCDSEEHFIEIPKNGKIVSYVQFGKIPDCLPKRSGIKERWKTTAGYPWISVPHFWLSFFAETYLIHSLLHFLPSPLSALLTSLSLQSSSQAKRLLLTSFHTFSEAFSFHLLFFHHPFGRTRIVSNYSNFRSHVRATYIKVPRIWKTRHTCSIWSWRDVVEKALECVHVSTQQ